MQDIPIAVPPRIEEKMRNQVHVFFNARSGQGSGDVQTIARLFSEHHCACELTELKRGVDIAASAAKEDPSVTFLAAGGDGTVNAVANAVAGTGRAMGVLPVGTLNHFAKDLGLPMELDAAVQVAACGHVRSIDVAEVNGSYFVNNSSLGMYPQTVVERERMQKNGWNKWASLVAASARAFLRFRHLEVELMLDGGNKRCRTPFVFIGNNEYCMEGMRLGSRERLDGQELWLFLAPGVTRAGMLWLAITSFFGRVQGDPHFEVFKVREFTVNVRRGRRIRVSLDGEVRKFSGPLRYCIHPGALQVLCPPDEPL